MKNILIIAKMDLFKEQPSNNRVDLLNFLSTKQNIKIMNDKEGQTLKNWINKTKKRVKWEPDVIMGINRGGCIPGVYLSHRLKISHEVLDIRLRDYTAKPNLSVLEKAFAFQKKY